MTALAMATQRVRVGCLMFCALYRNPGLLAKAAVTIDHLCGGRTELGIGAGWFEEEFREYGYGFPPLARRLDQLEEALQVVRSLLREPVTSFKGRYYQIEGAVCSPRPVQPRLRIWVGGRGAQRTPRIAARYADGYNLPYVSPEQCRERLAALARACEKIQRDPAEIESSANLAFAMGSRRVLEGPQAGGVLAGSPQEVTDRLGAYQRAGLAGVNLALRPPVDWEAFESFIENVLPAFHRD
jgi:alkanesulfonate monooxygenase SsuD/methylene tetrahydromethanopterin reductase-like flavin-dependent oxidoreductase (luciferase family)